MYIRFKVDQETKDILNYLISETKLNLSEIVNEAVKLELSNKNIIKEKISKNIDNFMNESINKNLTEIKRNNNYMSLLTEENL